MTNFFIKIFCNFFRSFDSINSGSGFIFFKKLAASSKAENPSDVSTGLTPGYLKILPVKYFLHPRSLSAKDLGSFLTKFISFNNKFSSLIYKKIIIF